MMEWDWLTAMLVNYFNKFMLGPNLQKTTATREALGPKYSYSYKLPRTYQSKDEESLVKQAFLTSLILTLTL